MSTGADRLALADLGHAIEDELENHTETFILNQTIRCEGCRAWVADDGGVPDLEQHRVQVAISMVSDRIADDIEKLVVLARRDAAPGEAMAEGRDMAARHARRYAETVRSRG